MNKGSEVGKTSVHLYMRSQRKSVGSISGCQ